MRALCALLFCDVTKDSLLSYYTHTPIIFKTDMRQIMKELVVTIDEDLDVRRINIFFFFLFFSLLLVSSFLTLDISSQCHVALFIQKQRLFVRVKIKTAARTEHALRRLEKRNDQKSTTVGVRANEYWANQEGKYGGGFFEYRAGVSRENRGRIERDL